MTETMWTIKRLIKAGLVKVKDDPTMNGICYHDTVWVPDNCTLNVYHDGYHEFIHYIYENIDGEIKFAVARSNECVENESTFFNPVMEEDLGKAYVDELLNLTVAVEGLENFADEPTFKLDWKKLAPLVGILALAVGVLIMYIQALQAF